MFSFAGLNSGRCLYSHCQAHPPAWCQLLMHTDAEASASGLKCGIGLIDLCSPRRSRWRFSDDHQLDEWSNKKKNEWSRTASEVVTLGATKWREQPGSGDPRSEF